MGYTQNNGSAETNYGISRRDFLRVAAGVTAGIGLAGLINSLSLPAHAQGTPNYQQNVPQQTAQVNNPLEARIDKTTYWTPEKFIREIAESDKITYVHWLWENRGNMKAGDEFLNNLIRDFPEIDRFVIIDLSKYGEPIWKQLVQIPARYNTDKSVGPVQRVPSGSLFKHKRELRIKGPPSDESPYDKTRAGMKNWLAQFDIPS
ncbi:twin-arginine translocation signal domain-containing protein [Candidatus Woesearchaeota archaeon]|nr:twin-arginine translocation signal domain-containing protein [Candidatus Woesearchaeota archaeon]